ncbi:SDR family NAD(P)-dependent oxidoreductase [Leuconostoc pseudomesenteroides]|uniref:SDR family NAD(P)-dependent oxidoreductase n=1 Tax=Leuconostoc pseudomesenteroides TaxID=33968 RepID=UPI0032DF5CD4
MKNIVITGGGSGVGFAIARDLSINNQVILVGRNEHKLQLAQTSLGNNVKYVAGDLSINSERQKVVEFILKNTDRIDVLIHSAGIYPTNSQDNINNNLLAHYYLTIALLKVLRGSRVLIVTGNPQAIAMAPICEQQFNALMRATWAITHKMLLVQVLVDQLAAQKTTINSFFPGDVKSNLMAYTKSLTNTSVPVGSLLALNEKFENVTGAFFDEIGNKVPQNTDKYNKNNAKRVLSLYIRELGYSSLHKLQ